ncbi:hypothetical protein [Paraglaciecola marina]|uniref:hypothetical protein n=1 Tax=Paraglaciecola marina TaxID=2500157 RepID=UPI001061D5D2|nr:hypothetical protein [Paraglaciecola marina]
MQISFLNRVEGVFVLINAFLPAIIVIVLSSMFYLTWKSAESTLAQYTESIENVIENAQVTKVELQNASIELAAMAVKIKKNGQEVVKNVNKMTKGFNATIDDFGPNFEKAVGNLSLDIKIPVIKKVVPIKFGKVLAKPMGKIGDAIAKPFGPLSDSFGDLGSSVGEIKQEMVKITEQIQKMQKMEIYLDAVIIEYQNILSNVTEIVGLVGRLIQWILIGICALVLWFALSYIIWVRRRVINAMQLIRGV